MRELRIEEQKNICGGTTWWFTDNTTGWYYTDENENRIKSTYYGLKDQKHDLTRLRHRN
ncbi:hypothetical protein NNC19_16185 [Clostridium sp. SHJSY1]|uniref:hypothetical protein n=1 Tax=Clostridium sp. SHJSY1 TaxID=2942483 RepID=UPI002875CCDB|nr:hypothetical protein [Clostridium sp. SHJSY1]MDS0527230.1 hypothetical protein [Clostridium sp. SHJSY1]